MQILAVANHKGGVGKTAVCHALGVLLASDRRVLMVDCDPQASLTAACGIYEAEGRSLAEVLGGANVGALNLADVVRDLGDGLALVPSDIELANMELGLVSRMGREVVLKRALASVAGDYDLALLDCPPSVGLLTVNALAAADAVLVPTVAEVAALRGLRLFLDTLEQMRYWINPHLRTLGIVPTFVDGRLVHHRDGLEAMQAAGLPLLPVTVGRSIRVAEAPGFGESVVTYDRRNKRTAELTKLAEVVGAWLDENRQ